MCDLLFRSGFGIRDASVATILNDIFAQPIPYAEVDVPRMIQPLVGTSDFSRPNKRIIAARDSQGFAKGRR